MKIVNPEIIIDKDQLNESKLANLEKYGRICYRSDSEFSTMSSKRFLSNLISRKHLSVVEHEKVTVIIITDRGVTHEIVRHRIGSYSQESTRYCNYANDKFGNEITVIKPLFYKEGTKEFLLWLSCMESIERTYLDLIKNGSTAQEARSVLPNSLKTTIAVTYNFREWRHFLELRCSSKAHPQMQQIAIPILLCFKKAFGCLFDDIDFNRDFDSSNYAEVKIIDDSEI